MVRVLIFLLICLPTALFAQFKIKTYSVGEGLAQSQVYDMLEDSRGYIWMGTKGGGISRFDGKKFKNFSSKDGLVNNYVTAFYEDEENNIWIGTNDGISIYNGISFHNFKINDLPNLTVNCFLKGKNGVLWIGTSKGLYQYKDEKFKYWTGINKIFNRLIYDIYEHVDGSIWASSDDGVIKIQGDEFRTYSVRDGLTNKSTRGIEGNESGIYISTFGGGLNKFDGSDFSFIETPVFAMNDILLDGNGIWISSLSDGILYKDFKTGKSKSINKENGLSANHTRLILKDRWGNLWFGTSGGGVNKYFGQEFEHITKNDWLADDYVYDVIITSEGAIWTSFENEITVNYNDTLIVYNSTNGYRGGKARVLMEDHLGNIWIGTDGNSVYCFNGDVFHKFTRSDGIPHYWITDIFQDKLLNIWIATSGGIAKLEPTQPNLFEYKSTIWKEQLDMGATPAITDIEEDQLGRIWFGTRNRGVSYILANQITNFRTKDGLAGLQIKSLKISPTGDLWIGTQGKGVSIASAQEAIIGFSTITTESGLSSDNTYLIEFDQEGNAWVGSEKGVDRIRMGEGNSVSEIKHFGKDEGFKGVETNRNASCLDRNGNLWFGTVNGLMQYNPKNTTINTIPPDLSLTSVTLFYEDLAKTEFADLITDWYKLKDTLVFKHDQNHVSFNFKGINQKNPEQVNYQFKLDGFDEQWSPVSEKSDATYSNLPPGSYTFKVIAGNEDDVWTLKPETFSFAITPPFWQTLWFLIGTIGIGSLILILIIGVRIRAIKQQVNQEKERLEFERSLLELEQKALRLQMNPHFIFNSLNSVQALILRNDQKSARYYLSKFSKLMRQTLENSRSQSITIQDEINTLKNYLDLENFGREEPFEYAINVQDGLDPDNILLPPMLLQPFAENAIIHGLKGIDRQAVISVSFECENEILTCTMSDNGIGRQAARKNKAQEGQKHKSAALEVTQERLSILNADTIEKGFEIIDLGIDGGETGTKIVLRMKLNELF
jgi:ligand-binding sensor domain-containing protein